MLTDEDVAVVRRRISEYRAAYDAGQTSTYALGRYSEDATMLLDEVARLNAEARRMTALHAQTVEELDAARAEVERLRAVTEAGRVEVLHQVDRASRAMDMLRELVTAADASYVDIHPFAGPGHSKIVGPFQAAIDQARALLARDEGEGAGEGSAAS